MSWPRGPASVDETGSVDGRSWNSHAFGKRRKALQIAREDADGRGDRTLSAEIHYSLGRALYLLNNYEEALAFFREGLRLALAEPHYPALQARLYTGIGHILYVENHIDEALSQYERARVRISREIHSRSGREISKLRAYPS